MTNTEVRDALQALLVSTATNIGPKVLTFAASYTHLHDRILVAPNAHTNDPGEDEADPQFVADLERLQAIAADLGGTFIPEY